MTREAGFHLMAEWLYTERADVRDIFPTSSLSHLAIFITSLGWRGTPGYNKASITFHHDATDLPCFI